MPSIGIHLRMDGQPSGTASLYGSIGSGGVAMRMLLMCVCVRGGIVG